MSLNITTNLHEAVQNTLRPFDDAFSIAFWMGDFPMRWYAIFFMLGFLIAIIVGCLIAHFRFRIKYDIIFWAGIIAVPTAFLGARLWSGIIGDLDWNNFFNFNSGGLAIQGGVILCGIVLMIYSILILRIPRFHVRVEFDDKIQIQRPSMWIIADIILPLVLIGQAIGRWGNFFNGEIFGNQVSASDLEWLRLTMPGIFDHMKVVAGAHPLSSGLIEGAYYQPLFLYEFAINIFSFVLILFIMPCIKQIKIGVAGSSYFILYGITRFIMEPLRFSAYEFSGTYVINGLLLVFGVILVIFAQFICPKYRDQKMLYKLWIVHIRYSLIKLGLKMNLDCARKYDVTKNQKEFFGLEKKPIFIRKNSDTYYYGGR